MKVGILTFHEGINHGGFFQAYCLQKYLEDRGYEVEIINYKNKRHFWNEYRAFLVTRCPFRLIKNLQKILAFRRAQSHLGLFPKRLTTNADSVVNASSRYDYIVIGSDVLWDYDFVFTGNDPIYFGWQLRPARAVVSYAASMGRSKAPPPDYVVKGLESFSAISVRDQNTKLLVEQYTNKVATKVLDPTLLFDLQNLITKEDLKNTGIRNEAYILIYAYLLPEKWRLSITKFADAKKLKIVVVGYAQPIRSIDMTTAGPFDWLRLFQRADYVITSTFHGTIFALLSQKRFLTVANSAIEHKAGSLLTDLNLIERYISGGFDEAKLQAAIDWHGVRQKLLELRKGSERFLRAELK